MEPATISAIATAALSAVSPLLKKGVEQIVQTSAEEDIKIRALIWKKVKTLFVGEDLTTLNLFEQNPENIEAKAELRGELKSLLKNNPAIASEIEELLTKLPKSEIKQNTANVKGDKNIVMQDISGTVNFNK